MISQKKARPKDRATRVESDWGCRFLLARKREGGEPTPGYSAFDNKAAYISGTQFYEADL